MRLKVKKQSGILLHISSLPSPYGIGTFGEAAYRFVDFLKESGQKYWQVLPLCPIGEGNSPYKSPSCFAGEILFIDLDFLVRDGLLFPEELPSDSFATERVDYEAVRNYKYPLLQKAVERFDCSKSAYRKFLHEQQDWLADYALFSAICAHFRTDSIADFPEDLKYRIPVKTEAFRLAHRNEIRFFQVTQYLFFEQYLRLRQYAEKNGIAIIGDMPFYVSGDSADVWSNPSVFKIGRDYTPVLVAGVPPDRFSASGQLWGNPIYDWDYLKRTRYDWWKKRFRHYAKLYRYLRIDHFRGFADYYAIPYGSANAQNGTWERGPGYAFFDFLRHSLGDLRIIAEDLGGENPETEKLLLQTGFPGMKVLQFAFESDLHNRFLPQNFSANNVCYTGTHDNNTTVGWYADCTAHERILCARLTPLHGRPVSERLIGFAMQSKAVTVIIPLQDWLNLDRQARMNTPGTNHGNWEWRVSETVFTQQFKNHIRNLSKRK